MAKPFACRAAGRKGPQLPAQTKSTALPALGSTGLVRLYAEMTSASDGGRCCGPPARARQRIASEAV